MAEKRTHPELIVTSRAQWREWLAQNGSTQKGILLRTLKKGTGDGYVPYEAAVEEALCFGWIDSKPGLPDPQYRSLHYTPRKAKSVWSAINRARIEKLQAEGKMEAAGIAAVDRAKADGSWEALTRSDSHTCPAELIQAFRENPVAAQHFSDFPPSTRKQLLQWIWSAKTDPTIKKRVREVVEKAARNERANQWKAK